MRIYLFCHFHISSLQSCLQDGLIGLWNSKLAVSAKSNPGCSIFPQELSIQTPSSIFGGSTSCWPSWAMWRSGACVRGGSGFDGRFIGGGKLTLSSGLLAARWINGVLQGWRRMIFSRNRVFSIYENWRTLVGLRLRFQISMAADKILDQILPSSL